MQSPIITRTVAFSLRPLPSTADVLRSRALPLHRFLDNRRDRSPSSFCPTAPQRDGVDNVRLFLPSLRRYYRGPPRVLASTALVCEQSVMELRRNPSGIRRITSTDSANHTRNWPCLHSEIGVVSLRRFATTRVSLIDATQSARRF